MDSALSLAGWKLHLLMNAGLVLKVYPSEATSAFGEKLNEISGLLSDDLDDDDYNPKSPDVEKNKLKDESSFGEYDFYSA
ncbi:hypothetical protein HAX54_010408 [Datura stramonium]|uniref:Uncharacterized protein n=1 Tax=Datura stramonium TaxID=4076 RepID=A0ABS8WVY1_DATST|nr:hypothetical protein [Datura stramonium]